jgi:hypothetical protein
MKKYILILVLIVLLLIPSLAYALTYNQPTTFTIGDASGPLNAYAFQSVLEPGDQFFMARFYVSYAVPANAPDSVGEAYLGSAKYNGTLLGTVQPYAFFDALGVAEWFYAIYLTASEVTAWNTFFGATMWATPANYSMQIVGNPMLTWAGGAPPAPKETVSFTSASFNANTDVATTTPIVEQTIRYLATYYEQRWGGAYDMVQEVGGVLKLTSTGEQYFATSITSLRVMAPGVFADSLTVADLSESKLITDYYVDLTDTNVQIYGVEWSAQTFTATDSYQISGIDVRLYRSGAAPGNITARLRAVALGVPDGPDLATGTINGNNITTYNRGEWYKIIFTTNVQLTSGTTYSVVLDAAAGNAVNFIVWRDSSTGTYAGGTRCASANSGVAWGISTHDFVFAIVSIEGASGAYQDKLSSHLDETEFGLRAGSINNLANSWGLSRNWTTSMLWLMFSLGAGIVASLAIKNNRPLFPIILIMLPIGSYSGFLLLNITIIVGLICALALVYVFAFKQTS